MDDGSELKSTIKIEGADEAKAAIKGTADAVGDATGKMSEDSIRFANAFDASMASLHDGTEQVGNDFDQLEKNIAKSAATIDRDLTKAFKTMAITGAAVTAAVTGAGVAAANNANEIVNWSIKLGISTDAVQQLSYVAQQFDLNLSSMGMAIRAQNDLMVKAAAGDDVAAASLRRLGLSYQQLAGLNPEEQFWALADAVSGLGTAQERSAAATDTWGFRVGMNLLPMLNAGKTGIQELRDRFAGLDITMNKGQLKTLQELNKSWKDMKAGALGFANTMGSVVAPVVKPIFDGITLAMTAAKKVMDLIPGPLKSIAAAGILGGGGLLAVAGGIGTVVQKAPAMIDSIKLGTSFLTGFQFAGKATSTSLIGLASNLVKTAAQFIVYVAKLIPVVIMQGLAMITNFPIGTAAAIAIGIGSAAAIYGLVKAFGGGGSETPSSASQIDTFMSQASEQDAMGDTAGAASSRASAAALAKEVPGMANGGVIYEPSLVTSLSTGRPLATVAENGPEAVGAGGGILITGNVFNVRQDSDIDAIAEALEARINRRVRYA